MCAQNAAWQASDDWYYRLCEKYNISPRRKANAKATYRTTGEKEERLCALFYGYDDTYVDKDGEEHTFHVKGYLEALQQPCDTRQPRAAKPAGPASPRAAGAANPPSHAWPVTPSWAAAVWRRLSQ
jgi:hypothetical protein